MWCAIHEIQPEIGNAEAHAIVGGISVCRKHLEMVGQALTDGYSVQEILADALGGNF